MTQVFVLAPERGGGSLAAKLLNDLGVPMSVDGRFGPPRAGYTHQTWEDRELFRINRTAMDDTERRRACKALVAQMTEAHGGTWGLKDPALCSLAEWYLAHADNPGIVVVWRHPAAVIASHMAANLTDYETAQRWYFAQRAAIDKLLRVHSDLPVLWLDFDALTERWDETLVDVARWLGNGEPAQAAARPDGARHFDAAGRWIAKTERRYGDWGRVAVGSRIGFAAETAYLKCYQNLILRGTRPGDAILEPITNMPGHWAADRMALDFLRSGCDSLFMLDDDMTFEPGALEQLRTVVEGQAFDVLMGFCTKRMWPPRPITMTALRYQPPVPLSLAGVYYKHDLDYDDGPVVERDMVGLAFTLIRRHVFEEMISEWGPSWTHFFPYVAHQSDDAAFCQRARSLGLRLGVALDVEIGHIGKQTYGKPQFNQWLGQLQAQLGG